MVTGQFSDTKYPLPAGNGLGPDSDFSSNNPYKSTSSVSSRELLEQETLAKEQQQSLDSEKQAVAAEALSGPENAPSPVVQESQHVKPQPVRDADKHVVDSWQIQSGEDNSPIPVYSEGTYPQGNLLNDIKGAPPEYSSLEAADRRPSDDGLAHLSIQPDNAEDVQAPRPEDRSAVGQLLSWMPPAPEKLSTRHPSCQPVIIPQLEVPPRGESVPFARCYSDALASHGVPMRDFLAFLDGLAVAQAPNSALQGLKLFGTGVGSLHIPLLPLAGKGISALATSGSGHSGSRARLYIERAKKEYFAPRNLRMTIVRDTDLGARIGLPMHASPLAPLTGNTFNNSLCKRRYEALSPYVAPLRFDVPEPEQRLAGVNRLARKQLDAKFKADGKRLAKLREEQAPSGDSGWEERYRRKAAEVRQHQEALLRDQEAMTVADQKPAVLRERLEELEDQQRRLNLIIAERQNALRTMRRCFEAETREIEWSRKLKWIVIENA